MKKIALYLFVLFCIPALYSQTPKNVKLVNSGDLLQKGISAYDNGKYDEAMSYYNQIPFGDTIYDMALYEISLVKEENEDYQGAIDICLKLLNDPTFTISTEQLYNNLGACYDELKQYDQALKLFNEAIQQYPYNYLLYFNRGIVYMRTKIYNKAIEDFNHAIFLNPAHQGSHYRYGLCNLAIGYTIPGLLALNYAICINPSSDYAIDALKVMTNVYESGINGYNKENDIVISSEIEDKNEFYNHITPALNSTLASTKQFKNESKIDFITVKSNQILFKNIESHPDSYTLEDQLYAPFFRQLADQKMLNTLAYYELSNTNLNDGAVSAKANKMGKKIDVIINKMIHQLELVTSKGIGFQNTTDTSYVYTNKFRLSQWGVYKTDPTGKQTKEGDWFTINSNGTISSIITYKNDQIEGLLRTFDNGYPYGDAMASNNILSGIAHYYFSNRYYPNKTTRSEFVYADNMLNGERKNYNISGALIQESFLKNNYYQGEVKEYNEQGNLSAINQYENGSLSGHQLEYFDNGNLKKDYFVGKTDERTPYIEYYANGKINIEGTLLNDKLVDTWSFYYPNGSLRKVSHYSSSGEPVGQQITYDRNHSISGIIEYANNKISQQVEYENNGKPLYKYTYKNGNLISVTTLFPDSTVRNTYLMKNNKITFDSYTSYGFINATLTIDNKGLLQGHQIYYYPNGQIKFEYDAKDDLYEGNQIAYYSNGNIKSFTQYHQNNVNGYHINYYNNAAHTIQNESTCHNDTIFGAHYKYWQDGSIQSKYRFDKNGNLLYTSYYLPDGKITSESYFLDAIPYLAIAYDKDGNVTHRDTFPNGKGVLKNYDFTGNPELSVHLFAGNWTDTLYYYSPSGQIISKTRATNDQWDGPFTSYLFYPDLKSSDENYVLNKKEGIFTYYSFGNIISKEKYFEEDQCQGISKTYYDDGTLWQETAYENDNRHGKQSYYAPDGKTILYELINYYDEPILYSYRQQDGQMSAFAPIGNKLLQITGYYPSGKIGAVVSYDNGNLNGMRTFYYSNGQAAESAHFTKGLLDGTNISYYPNGQIHNKATYKEDAIMGDIQSFFENGKPFFESSCYYDEYHGDMKIYNKNGGVNSIISKWYGVTYDSSKH